MPAPAALKKPATYDDLVRVPDHLVAEIVGAELFATPRPTARHARAASVLGMDLGGPFDRGRGGPGGWWILDEPELHLSDDVVVPDLAGWRRDRLPAIPDTAALTLAPDWICEVVSPSSEALDRGRKLAVYAREGVAHAWLVNPANETLEVFALDSGRWTLLGTHMGAATVRVEPFAAIELDLSDLWSHS
ncbi:MAG TPA: Uma2 family endonuclease [Vicinamibacterales bacterium]|nr:Uma2 family endonuclease [Vicinamibacterales bacterium]